MGGGCREADIQEGEMENVRPRGTGDERNIARVLDNAKWEAEACSGYASGAEEAGNGRLADFFREVRESHMRVAARAEELLGGGADEQHPAGVPTGGPVEGDPGDVSPDQDDVA